MQQKTTETDSLVPCVEVMQGWIMGWNVIWIGRGEKVGQRCQLVTIGHAGLTYIFNFRHSGTLALSYERQSARMSEIKNVG